MNENTKNMVAELQKEFPNNWGDPEKGLKISVCDNESEYFEEDNLYFPEKIFYGVRIAYKEMHAEITKEECTDFNISIYSSIGLENLANFTKIINIISKHLSRMDFEN